MWPRVKKEKIKRKKMYFFWCSRCSITLWMKRSLTILEVWRTGSESWKKRRRGSGEKERRIWRSQQVTSPRKRRRKTDALIASCKIKKLDICTKEVCVVCVSWSVLVTWPAVVGSDQYLFYSYLFHFSCLHIFPFFVDFSLRGVVLQLSQSLYGTFSIYSILMVDECFELKPVAGYS